ncbi:MAG TPA: hypothetical protein VMT34_04610 [Aggregatilineales bacterium]|nr:hypothetical protein [Aggregatilineales bacterium]
MAKKKSRRPNLSQETLERARAELRGVMPVEPVVETEPETPAAVAAPVAKKVVKRPQGTLATRRIPTIPELIEEYRYVLHDLRNILILAAVLLILIVAATVLLPRPVG